MRRLALMAVVLSACVLLATVSHAAPFANGGFETGAFTGWTVTGGCVLVSTSAATLTPPCNTGVDTDPGPHGGTYAAYIGDPTLGTVSQTFDTTVGQAYQISFYLANTSLGGSTPNAMNVTLNGNTLLSLTNFGASPYLPYSYSFVAASTTSTLTFSASHTPAFWVLDDVSLAAIPEPASAVLLCTALIVLGALKHKRRS